MTKLKFTNFKDFFARELKKDPLLQVEMDKLKPEFDIIEAIIKKRIASKMTQKQLAAKMGTKQSALSRLEAGNANPSLNFLKKLASAMDTTLHISFE